MTPLNEEPDERRFYSGCTEFLQQGDVFRVGIVTPLADYQQRIFRADDARHGSVVFTESANGKVFDREELETALSQLGTRTDLHTAPFQSTADGQPELVVVFAGFSQHFVIATQTCDVSGKDKNALPYAIILPAKTLMEICQIEKVELQGQAPASIEDYLVEQTGDQSIRSVEDPVSYAAKLRAAVEQWTPSDNLGKANQKRIINFLNRVRRTTAHLYYLPASPEFGMPELVVDFSVTYTVAIRQLEILSARRVARIGDPYRDHFARAFSDRISRIAVPVPPQAEQFGTKG